MDTRKYKSPLGGDISTSKTNKGRGWKGLKGQAALALAVSLWIGCSGVAWADAESKTITVNGGTDKYIYNGIISATNPWSSRPTGEKTLFNTIINGGTLTQSVLGGFSYDENANNNTLAAVRATIKNDVYGGYSHDKHANNNTVTLTDVTITSDNRVIGGSNYQGDANGNTVILVRSTADKVYGGSINPGHSAFNNTVSLTDSQVYMVAGSIFNYGEPRNKTISGNKLELSGANAVTNAIYNMETVKLKDAVWNTSKPMLTVTEGRDAVSGHIFANNDDSKTSIDTSGLKFTNAAAIEKNATMNLITAPVTMEADLAAGSDTHTQNYTDSVIVSGLTANGILQGSMAFNGAKTALTYTATSNVVNKLTFGNVEWKDTGALYTRPDTITFNSPDVDTTNISFTNIRSLAVNKTMTLISNFGQNIGTITGTKYKVGSTLEGEGKASLVGEDLIFTAETGVESLTVQEQTHNTVMGAEVGMAALSAGNDFVGAATEGLAMAGNTGTDGMATYANMGGGSMNVETGSHVKTHTWNAILALGHKNEKKLSTTEYGAFFEYGTGNYSTFNGDERGDGSTRYTGGGILGKWQKNNGFYVEGSLRAGSIHDDAHNVLRDANGNPYSYTTDATYWGAHIGVGREIKLNKTAVLDLYAKYFYNHRGSVSFDAGGHYDLGAVESSVLRVGTRYTVKQNDNINYYGGLAVEHEFCGRASGFADGVAIRGADISGTSVRGEIGATFRPGEKSNVTLDLNLSGFAGKKQGFTGGLSAVFHI